MMRRILSLSLFILAGTTFSQHPIAHAHNDYENERPLFQALESDFRSIEIDVFEHNGQLKVSHLGHNLRNRPSLTELYFDPLDSYLKRNPSLQLWLLIDLKQEDRSLLDLLHAEVQKKSHLFKSKGAAEIRPIQIILSGSVDRELIATSDAYQYFYLDGRIQHLENQNWDSELMPLISANLTKVVSWNGKGKLSTQDADRIKELVSNANSQGKRLRFWRTRDNEYVWKQLMELGVDVIGTDEIAQLSSFLKSIQSEPK